MTNNNSLQQRRGESLEDYIARIKAMTSEEILEATEKQRTQILADYSQHNSKPTNYRRKVYHK